MNTEQLPSPISFTYLFRHLLLEIGSPQCRFVLLWLGSREIKNKNTNNSSFHALVSIFMFLPNFLNVVFCISFLNNLTNLYLWNYVPCFTFLLHTPEIQGFKLNPHLNLYHIPLRYIGRVFCIDVGIIFLCILNSSLLSYLSFWPVECSDLGSDICSRLNLISLLTCLLINNSCKIKIGIKCKYYQWHK